MIKIEITAETAIAARSEAELLFGFFPNAVPSFVGSHSDESLPDDYVGPVEVVEITPQGINVVAASDQPAAEAPKKRGRPRKVDPGAVETVPAELVPAVEPLEAAADLIPNAEPAVETTAPAEPTAPAATSDDVFAITKRIVGQPGIDGDKVQAALFEVLKVYGAANLKALKPEHFAMYLEDAAKILAKVEAGEFAAPAA